MGRMRSWHDVSAWQHDLRKDLRYTEKHYTYVEEISRKLRFSYCSKYGFINPTRFMEKIHMFLLKEGDGSWAHRPIRIPPEPERDEDMEGEEEEEVAEEPPILFKDFVGAGMDSAAELIKLPFYQTHMSGILLHGPPGCDTTNLARAIAYEFRVPFYQYPGQDTILQFFFFKAYQTAPSIVFIDDILAIDDVNQLLMCMDDSRRLGSLLVIGATNSRAAIPPAFIHPRRFDCEVALGTPDDSSSRVHILSVLTTKMENLTI